jgi:hypothetical protein
MHTATSVTDAAALPQGFEIIGHAAPETQTIRGRIGSPSAPPVGRSANASMAFLILSTQRVIQHYRRLLAHPISDAERDAIRERIRREERFLQRLCETD